MMKGKANELLAQYMQAELSGHNELAESIETELNDAGWFIITGADGMMVEKQGGGFLDGINSPFSSYPTESRLQPYNTTKDEKSPWNTWLIVGLSVTGLIGIIALTVYLIKRFKKNG